MKVRSLHIVKQIITCLLIISLSGVFYNNLVNRHSHNLADGTKIFHAHPYEKNSGSDHSHTNQQFILLQSIYELFSALPIAIALVLMLTVSGALVFKAQLSSVLDQVFYAFSNKAPPSIYTIF